jgi:hypothetical protein
MAKRFITDEAYEDLWFRKLPVEVKQFFHYMVVQCDMAGLWKVDIEKAEFNLLCKLPDREQLLKMLNVDKERVKEVDSERWWLVDFIEFQYGRLGSKAYIHKNVLKVIFRDRIRDIVVEEYPYLQTVLDSSLTGVELESNSSLTQDELRKSKSESKSKELLKLQEIKEDNIISTEKSIYKSVTEEQAKAVQTLIDQCGSSTYFKKVITQKDPALFFFKMTDAYGLSVKIVSKELKKMEAWLISHPRRQIKDPRRFINNWLGRASEDYGEHQGDGGEAGGKPKAGKYDDVPVQVV